MKLIKTIKKNWLMIIIVCIFVITFVTRTLDVIAIGAIILMFVAAIGAMILHSLSKTRIIRKVSGFISRIFIKKDSKTRT